MCDTRTSAARLPRCSVYTIYNALRTPFVRTTFTRWGQWLFVCAHCRHRRFAIAPDTTLYHVLRNMQDVTTLDTVSEHAETNENLWWAENCGWARRGGPRRPSFAGWSSFRAYISYPFYAQPKLKCVLRQRRRRPACAHMLFLPFKF